MFPSDSLPSEIRFRKLIRFLFTFRWWVGSLQFRTTLFIHTVSYIPRDSSVLFSSFSTRSMVFAYFAKAQLPFFLFRDLFNDTAEFTLCYGLHDCSHLFQGYFIHSLSTLYYYNAPSLATRLTGDYRDRTYTGKCSPALLDTHKRKAMAWKPWPFNSHLQSYSAEIPASFTFTL